MCSGYSEHWYENESLASFYLSTNSFSNPLFDGELLASQQSDQFGQPERASDQNHPAEQPISRPGKFCDSFAFSLKNKLCVMELNLKQKLRQFRRYLRTQLTSSGWTRQPGPKWSLAEQTGRKQRRRVLDKQHEQIMSRLEHMIQTKRLGELAMKQQRHYLYDMHLNGLIASSPFNQGSQSAQSSSPYAGALGCPNSLGLSSLPKDSTCVVCYTNRANVVTLPCKHHQICSDCFIETIYMAIKHSQYPLKCVLCRQKVERIRCSRHLLFHV